MAKPVFVWHSFSHSLFFLNLYLYFPSATPTDTALERSEKKKKTTTSKHLSKVLPCFSTAFLNFISRIDRSHSRSPYPSLEFNPSKFKKAVGRDGNSGLFLGITDGYDSRNWRVLLNHAEFHTNRSKFRRISTDLSQNRGYLLRISGLNSLF